MLNTLVSGFRAIKLSNKKNKKLVLYMFPEIPLSEVSDSFEIMKYVILCTSLSHHPGATHSVRFI